LTRIYANLREIQSQVPHSHPFAKFASTPLPPLFLPLFDSMPGKKYQLPAGGGRPISSALTIMRTPFNLINERTNHET
jgi:hypothetical protein